MALRTAKDRAKRLAGWKAVPSHRGLTPPVEVRPPGAGTRQKPAAARIEAVRRELANNSLQVAALSRPVMAQMGPIIDQARREVAKDLAAWLKTVPDGELRYTAQHYRATLAALENSFTTIRGLEPELAQSLSSMAVDAGQLATDHLVSEVARFSKVFEGVEVRVPVKVAAVIQTGQSYLIPRFRTSAHRYAGDIASDIKRELAVGVLRRESVYELTNRLVRLGGPKGEVALRGVKGEPGAVVETITEGLFRRYRYWAERIARTETTAAYAHQAHAAQWEARKHVPDLQRRWDASVDGRNCMECRRLDGQVVDFGERFSNGSTDAPAHPNCRCRVGAWRRGWKKLIEETK